MNTCPARVRCSVAMHDDSESVPLVGRQEVGDGTQSPIVSRCRHHPRCSQISPEDHGVVFRWSAFLDANRTAKTTISLVNPARQSKHYIFDQVCHVPTSWRRAISWILPRAHVLGRIPGLTSHSRRLDPKPSCACPADISCKKTHSHIFFWWCSIQSFE